MGKIRTSSIISPTIDATSGRSYKQASQTPGALGGRRAVVRWHSAGPVDNTNIDRYEPTIRGSWWRLIAATARVRVPPAGGTISVDIKVNVPGAGATESIFDTLPTIAAGAFEASGGVLKEPRIYPVPWGTFHRIYPPNTLLFLFHSSFASTLGEDLTVELHYMARPVSQ